MLSDGTTVDAGGAAFLATHVRQLRAEQRNSLVLSGGDNIGASPLASALFHDEPTIEFLNSIGTTASAVGNHELDEGYQELLRIQFGGCHPVDGCQFHNPYPGAQFPYLASNITFTSSGLPATLPFTIKDRRTASRSASSAPPSRTCRPSSRPTASRASRSATRPPRSTGPRRCCSGSASRPSSW